MLLWWWAVGGGCWWWLLGGCWVAFGCTYNGKDDGDLSEIRRFYVQDGKRIENPVVTVGDSTYDSITDNFCATQKSVFGDTDDFSAKGGLKNMGEAMDRGLVLVMSIWDDYDVQMLWLDL